VTTPDGDRETLLTATLEAGGSGEPAANDPPGEGDGGTDAGGGGDDGGPEGQEPDPEKPVPFKTFKSRIDKLISQREQATAVAAETKDELGAMRAELDRSRREMKEIEARLAQKPAEPDDDYDDDDPTSKKLASVQAELKAIRQSSERTEQRRRIQEQALRLRREIESATKTYSKANLEEVVREMRLDTHATPLQAARVVHEKELAREKAILSKYTKAKTDKADATRRPPSSTANPLGDDVTPAPTKPAQMTQAERVARLEESMVKHNVFGQNNS